MRTIHKYPLEIFDIVTVEMPRGAKAIAVAEQAGKLCLWAEVDDSESVMVPQAFRIVGTGNRLYGDEGRHIGTVICADGVQVWHVYELRVDAAKGARCKVCGKHVDVPKHVQGYEWTCEQCQIEEWDTLKEKR